MEALRKICRVLELQRANIEREIAVIESNIRAIDQQIKAIAEKKVQLTQSVFSGDVSGNIVQDAVILAQWANGQDVKTTGLHQRKKDLIAAKAPKTLALKEIIVKEDVLSKKLELMEKEAYDEWVDTQASERLETWVSTHIT